VDVDADVDVDVDVEEALLFAEEDFGRLWVVVVLFPAVAMLCVRVRRREVALRLFWNQLVTEFTSLHMGGQNAFQMPTTTRCIHICMDSQRLSFLEGGMGIVVE
jgi:hypothetical protein